MKSIALQLHELFNSLELKRYRFPFEKEAVKTIPKNGVYIFFEEGETFQTPERETLDRIVRVGTHTGKDNLLKRLKNHFSNSSNSVFRKRIKQALDKRSKKDVTKEEITAYMKENLSFVVFEVEDEKKRLEWEMKLIQTLSKATVLKEIQPTANWLGNEVNEIKYGGLWQVDGIYYEITNNDLTTLKAII